MGSPRMIALYVKKCIASDCLHDSKTKMPIDSRAIPVLAMVVNSSSPIRCSPLSLTVAGRGT